MFGEAGGRKDGGSATVRAGRAGLESLSEETLPAKQNKLPAALLSAFRTWQRALPSDWDVGKLSPWKL